MIFILNPGAYGTPGVSFATRPLGGRGGRSRFGGIGCARRAICALWRCTARGEDEGKVSARSRKGKRLRDRDHVKEGTKLVLRCLCGIWGYMGVYGGIWGYMEVYVIWDYE